MKTYIPLLLIWLSSQMLCFAQDSTAFPNLKLKREKQVQQGLIYQHYQQDSTQGDPLSIHVLQADLARVFLKIGLAMDQITGQETTSSMVKRHNALAGINGGFSFSNDPWNRFHGDPRDFLVLDGKILSEPYSTRSSLGIHTHEDGSQDIFFDQIKLETRLIVSSVTKTIHDFPIHGINRQRKENEVILYTPEWAASTLTEPGGFELTIHHDYLFRGQSHSSVIPDKAYVLSASGNYADTLKQIYHHPYHMHFELEQKLSSRQDSTRQVRLAGTCYHTAGPTLLLNGEVITDHSKEDIRPAFVSTRHPRTAVGISEDKQRIWLVVVDGRQPKLSVGMSLPELTAFLQKLGAYHGYNLDGGGSSTLVVGGEIKNSFSDPQERRRCDALLVFGR